MHTDALSADDRTPLGPLRHSQRADRRTRGLGSGRLEKTIADLLSDAGYTCAVYGKWHVGEGPGRWPTDKGFAEWYGPPRTYDEALWPDDPFYDPERDPVSRMVEIKRGEADVTKLEQMTLDVRRDCDAEFLRRATAFIRDAVADETPFYVYFNHSMMHMPVIPREEFKGKTGKGDWAESLLELDADFGTLLDLLDELGVAEDTIVVFAGDNGPEEVLLWRGSPGYWEGSYFAGGEGDLRTPCTIRWPGHVPAGRSSNEIMHVTDWRPCCAPLGSALRPTASSTGSTSSTGLPAATTSPPARGSFSGWGRRCTARNGTTSSSLS